MKNRIALMLSALLIAVGLGFLTASPATATHPQVTGSPVCNTKTGLYDITWKVTGDPSYPDVSAQIKSQSIPTNPTLVGKTVKGSTGESGLQADAAPGSSHTMKVAVQFSNHKPGDLVTNEGKVKVPSDPCKPHDECPDMPEDQPPGTDCNPPPDCDKVCPVKTKGTGSDVVCRGVLSGTYNNVAVPPGATCTLVDAHVNGRLYAKDSRNVLVYDTTIVGDVLIRFNTGDVIFGNKDGCTHDPVVGGNLIVRQSHNVLICQTSVCKAMRIVGNDGRITLADNAMRRLIVNNNRRFNRDGVILHGRESAIRLRNITTGTLEHKRNHPRQVLKKNVRVVGLG